MFRKIFIPVFLTLTTLLAFPACNMFSAVDKPSTDTERLQSALALMDEGKCSEAAKLYDGKSGLTDDELHTLGWAQMCGSGAKLANIAKSLFTYTSASNNTSLIGTVANSLIPQNDNRIIGLSNAVGSFGQIRNDSLRNVDLIMADIVKAAAVVAKYSASNAPVVRSNISTSTCPTDCTTATGGNCASASGMSDADANTVGTLMIAASGSVNYLGPSAGSLGDLTSAIASGASASTGAINRCIVQTKFLAN